jgi:hypothetical protein
MPAAIPIAVTRRTEDSTSRAIGPRELERRGRPSPASSG